ncbi:MAG: branched-chain amino acid ABC transporter ATP-binding protein/permease [Burkholderiaceae bacterium]
MAVTPSNVPAGSSRAELPPGAGLASFVSARARQRARALGGLALLTFALVWLPMLGLPAFYDAFLYSIFHWIALATSWALISGYAGYFSLGHAAWMGAGMYTSATLAAKYDWPYLLTIPFAGIVAALLALAIGALVFRLPRLRGELFALMTLSVTFIVATIILNTPIDGGSGVFLSAVPVPELLPTQTGSIYLLAMLVCMATLASAWWVLNSRFGLGLFAIADDEDVAEVKGVPTFRYKMTAFALSSGLAGTVGGVHAIYVGFLTVGETFGIAVPLSVILMSVLGGARTWLGPALGATLITVALMAFATQGLSVLGRAVIALLLIIAILFFPDGLVPAWVRRRRARAALRDDPIAGATDQTQRAVCHSDAGVSSAGARPSLDARVVLSVDDVHKSFGGVHALSGATLEVREGEILGLIGPNGCGKTTLINMITGHLPLTSGTIRLDGRPISGLPAHRIAGRGIARTYQIPRPFAHLTTQQNVELCALFSGLPAGEAHEQAWHWLGFCELAHRAAALPGELNLRERKVLELARALAARPRLLLLDEVMSGLNPTEVDNAISLVSEIRGRGTTIVFVEHLMRAVVQLSDRVVVMNQGEVLTDGLPDVVMRDERVQAIYFGHRRVA